MTETGRATRREGRARARPSRDRPTVTRSRVVERSRSVGSRARAEPPESRQPTRRLTGVWIMSVITVLVMIGYTSWFTPLFGARRIEVSGVSTLTAGEVREAAAIDPKTPIPRLDADEIADRIRALSRVDKVDVELSWPSTVRLIITERVAVFQARVGEQVALIDRTGMVFATTATPPAGVPELRTARQAPDDPATRSALTMLSALDDRLRPEVLVVQADSPADVRAALAGGRQVIWGGPDESPRKAAVLRALLSQPGRIYNVSTPALATITP